MPQQPQDFDRRILLAVTGNSPQIVTETLFALAVQQAPAFVPTEIHVISTSQGLERARLMLLDPDQGQFHALIRDYGLEAGAIHFTEDCLHVIRDASGQALADIADKDGNEAAANLILEKVREFCSDEASAVHASIAGGRKTMGYYLGYAMSLLGRHQDRLSHVLVNAPFESSNDFFFPPAQPRRITVRDEPVHTRDARVMLADIPFVRLSSPHTLKGLQAGTGFTEAVEQIQSLLGKPSIHIDFDAQTLRVQGRPIQISRTQLAWYVWFALRVLVERPDVVLRETSKADIEELVIIFEEMNVPTSQVQVLEKLEEIDNETIGHNLRRINKALQNQLGTQSHYEISNVGPYGRATYRLPLRPENIRLDGLNRDHIMENMRARRAPEKQS